jgi:hypothetical protein
MRPMFVIVRSPCDEAIQTFLVAFWIARCARNDVERSTGTSMFVIARSPCGGAIQSFTHAQVEGLLAGGDPDLLRRDLRALS